MNASINPATFRRYRRQGISPVRSHFPPSPSIDAELAGCFLDGPATSPPQRSQLLREFGRIGKGIVAEEGEDHGKGFDRGFRLSLFAVQGGRCGHSEPCAGRCLHESTLEPPLPNMLPEGLRLEIGFLWFRALKRDRSQWQKATRRCLCGFLGHYSGTCRCTPDQVARYRRKISGPLLDRIDLHIDVPAVPPEEVAARATGESSDSIRARHDGTRTAARTTRQAECTAH